MNPLLQHLVKVVEEIVKEDPRYNKSAYFFTHRAVRETAEAISKQEKGKKRQISGKELMEGIRGFALEQFGPMSMTVLNSWNVFTSRDFGEIVFRMVEKDLLGISERDRIEDFNEVYEFEDVFVKPFQAEKPRFPRISLERLEEGTLELPSYISN